MNMNWVHSRRRANWVSAHRNRTSNQLDQITISGKFRNFLLDVRNKNEANTDLEGDHRLMLACRLFHIASASSRRHRELNMVSC